MEGAEFEICCETMRSALYGGQCVPGISRHYPTYLVSCDGWRDDIPLRFCPWCGKSIERKPSVSREGTEGCDSPRPNLS